MTLTRKRGMFHRRRLPILRWSQRLLFMIGSLALGYVGFTLLDARLYQASAKQSLQLQIQAEKEHSVTGHNPAVKEGDVVGRLDIPRLRMSVSVLQGTDAGILRRGAGHIAGTPLPGEAGNIAIAGHRDTFFRDLKDIQAKDEILLQTATGLFRFEVDWMKVVEPEDTTVLQPSEAESTLTLVTCYPFYFVGPSPKRFVVRAHKH